MKTLWTTLFSGLMICGVLLAQQTTPPQQDGTAPPHEQNRATSSNTQGASEQPGSQQRQVPQEGGNGQSQTTSEQTNAGLRIAPGSIIPVQLTKTIDAKKVKTGDEVEAKVTQDLTTGNGEVILPKDTKVIGHVTEAQTRSKEQKSQIGIAFDHTVGKNRDTAQLPMSIQAIIAPPSLNSDNHSVAGESAGLPPSAQTPGGMSPGNSSGRSTGMGTGTPQQAPSPSTAGGQEPASTQTSTNVHQPITGNTQGVVGISNLQLAMAANSAQGSVVSSEKGNVKLESGTLMLLRVNQ